MPRFGNVIENGRMTVNLQTAQIVTPPLMKVVYFYDATANLAEILPAQAGKSYIIHAYRVYGCNNAGTACQNVSLNIKEYFSGKDVYLETLGLVANQVDVQRQNMNGLNVMTYPSSPVTLYSDAAPAYRSITLYYSEVDA